jgi:hypothetical protein
VETLLKKLQEQAGQKAGAAEMLLTVKMLEAELQQLPGSTGDLSGGSAVAVTLSCQTHPKPSGDSGKQVPGNRPEEKIIEVLQVDEAEIEAELEEIKKNAETMQKISAQNKPPIAFETGSLPVEEIPTLAHQSKPVQLKKEVNESVPGHAMTINEKLRQSKIDLGDEFLEVPIRDLRKAIGVNERYLFIHELFRGDEVSYERSIKTINSFSILPEAEYWIQRELKIKNGWKDSNEVVKQFDQLVKRRFS